MKFPYGTADFHKIITDGYYYADRTAHIRTLENAGEQLLLLRPRRFGKTAWLTTLENYYDLARAGEFDALFASLAIGRDPTARRNQYFVLRWDFSMVDASGSLAEIRQALHDHLNSRARAFFARYRDHLGRWSLSLQPENGLVALESAVSAARAQGHDLYLLIDEYDNFANELMQGRHADYEALVSGEGLLKTLFKAVKSLASGQGIDRVFITGVSPVVLADISSGYNVSKDISLDARFVDLCGFTESEITAVLDQLAAEQQRAPEWSPRMLATMRTWYNGYRFGYEPGPGLYNPTLALYFFDALASAGQPPREMLDNNLAMDRNRIDFVARQPHGQELIGAALDPEHPPVIASLAHRFGVEDLRCAPRDAPFLGSLLYFLGALTLKDQDAMGRLVLDVPNLVIRKLYVEKFRDQLFPEYLERESLRAAAESFYTNGDLGPLVEVLETNHLRVFDNRDYRWSNELTVKTVFLVALFADIFYVMDSETAIARGHADLSLMVREEMRRFALLDHLLEFKYLSLQDLGESAERLRQLSREELSARPQVAALLDEAEAQLVRHRQGLEQAYGGRLRLHTHAVVALGFERLLWRSTPPSALSQ
ncbi:MULTISPECIES: AAA family ATPase [Thiorhodovibrio]|uniref:AAA family ATPase n=1 Tax=Thiorhodovibrio TaxID=61593 RepID=UPI0019120858|nr:MULTISPECIES: AAA family ATPase [Thiorhodovibrio]MBK5967734.1 AAA family ATPase [Thiorhodovibrio winogradskyi]WPL11681.1 putative AAA-ATPase [Thiorhodovibrio litoralis]